MGRSGTTVSIFSNCSLIDLFALFVIPKKNKGLLQTNILFYF